MPRQPDGAEPRTTVIPVRFTPTGARFLDVARGAASRSAYLRRLVAEDVVRRNVQPPDTLPPVKAERPPTRGHGWR